MTNKHTIFLALAISITFATIQTAASTHAPASVGTKKTPESATQPKQIKTTKPAESTATSSQSTHLFPVNDSKGLLLTCIAPEIDTNPDTDVFQDCALAPGRTLDDVMHTFVGAIHLVQHQQIKERSERTGDLEEEPAQKPEHK
ncbi:MAG: hypothetical protein ABR905_13305 [Terracidiphilus sp.]|jgi:hypothetical protein